MTTFETLDADVVKFFTWFEGWAVTQHQRTNDAGFAAIARLAGKFGAVFNDPANAADIAAVKAMVAQDLPSLAAPSAPDLPDAPSSESPSHYAGEGGKSIYTGQETTK